MNLIFNVKNRDNIVIQLKRGDALLDELALTISQDFDTLLIKAIDNIIAKNTIGRLSLNKSVIKGKIEGSALWGMILKTVKSALEN